ncbi:MAG: hypothetical protein Kow0080_03870 [Candidatus Promineifilaceae bacterium]
MVNNTQQPEIAFHDVIVTIGNLTFDAFLADRTLTPFAEYGAGDHVPIQLLENNRSVQIRMPVPSTSDRVLRLIHISGWFLPFWLAGSMALLSLRPRDNRWLLLVVLFYALAVWVAANPLAGWQLNHARLFYSIASYVVTAVLLHFHLITPKKLFKEYLPAILLILYLTVFSLIILEFLHKLPRSAPVNSAMTGSLISVVFLIYQALFVNHQPAKTAARIMLAGLLLGFLPGIVYQIIGEAFTNSSGSSLGFALALWAIPLMPIFYLYAIYKRQLGDLEFRANRVLSIYSFILLYPPAFLILILLGESRISNVGPRTAYLMAISALFIIFMNPLLSRYQKWINKLAYGTTHNPDDLIRLFASRIPLTRKHGDLVMLLKNEFLSSLLIRESAIVLFASGKQRILYVQGWQKTAVSTVFQHLELLQQTAGKYRPPILTTTLPWLRLVIPLTSGNQLIGYWLFGSRDPDDFYPLPDINLLTDLANEIAPVLENIQLYENLETEVEKRTAELKVEKDRTQAILETAGEGIFFTDTLGRIKYANPAMSRITGFTADHTRIPVYEWTYDDKETAVSLANAIKTQQTWSGQATLLRPDTTTIDISLILTPLKTNHPNLSGFVGVLSNISHFKEIDKLKSNIISNVSHELKTPLANITLYIDLLQRSSPENHPRYIETLKQNTNRLNTLIQDLLDLAKLETKELPTQRAPISIIDLIQRTAESLQPLIQKANKTVKMQMPNHLPPVLADGQQIEQVLSNLITNSLKYSGQADTITISAKLDMLDRQPAIAVSVVDKGPGIPQHELPFIFDRFFRGETHKDQAIAGSGLGLAICKEIIERHHGRIIARSTPHEETRFTFWLHTIDPK